jgi:hypothetical protein
MRTVPVAFAPARALEISDEAPPRPDDSHLPNPGAP